MNDFQEWLDRIKEASPDLKIPVHIEQSIKIPKYEGRAVPCLKIDFYQAKYVPLNSTIKPISKFIKPF